ncbi:MAG: hypothetical protein ACRBB3_10610 [Alphaproteobacteria bacterium]
MAGPNQTGDNDKKAQDEALRNEEAAQALNVAGDTEANAQQTQEQQPQPPVETVESAEPSQDIEPEGPTPEEIASTQDAERAVMAGRDANNLGDNATSNATLDAAEALSSGPDAQDIVDEAHKNETQYGFGADAAAKQMNDALSGAGEGKTNTTFTAKTSEAEEQRKKEDSLANIRAIALTAAQLDMAYAQLGQDVQAMGLALDEQNNKLTALVNEYDSQFKEIEDLISAGENKLVALNESLQGLEEGNLHPDELAARQQELRAEITKTEKMLTVMRDTLSDAQRKLEIAQEQHAQTQSAHGALAASVASGRTAEDPEAQLNLLNERKQSLQASVQETTKAQQDAFNAVELLKGMSEDNAFTKNSELVSLIAAAAGADGNIDQNKLNDISEQLNATGISKDDRNELINNFTALGGTITVDDPTNPGQSKVLKGDDVTAHLQSEWNAIKEEIDKTEAEIDYTAESRDALIAEIAALKEQRDALAGDLKTAEDTLQKEQSESIEAATGAQEIAETTLKYDSVYDYMSTNYSTSIFGVSVGDGENIADVANDPNRILTYNDKLVYVSPETQEMYTLGADGEKVEVPPVDTIKLYQKMYDEKLLPRNFVEDEGGAHKEFSEHDSFSMTMAKSLLPGNMTAEQTQSLIDKAAKIEAQEAQEAKLAAEQAQDNINEAQSQVDTLKDGVNQKDVAIAQLEAELKQHQAALAQIEDQQAANSSGEAVASQESDESKTQWEGNEAHNMAIPDHDLVDAEASRNAALKEVELAALNGASISQEDYDKLKALPGMSETQLTDMMNENKVELAESGTTPDNSNDATATANPSNKIVAQQFGVKFEVTPIQVPEAPAPNPNGISPAAKYESFADSLDFTKTNDPSSTTNSYDPVAVKQSGDAPTATSGFMDALIEKPDEPETSTPKIDGMTPLQAEQLRIQEEHQRQAALAALAAQNAGGSGGISG